MSEPSRHGRAGKKALVIEDVRLAEIELARHGYDCTRITHDEAIGTAGTTNIGKLLKGDFNVLWISTPNDWRVRTRKASALIAQLAGWMQKAVLLGMIVILFGTPGFLWKSPEIIETIDTAKMHTVRIRLCHFKMHFTNQNPAVHTCKQPQRNRLGHTNEVRM